jgi:flagellin
MGFRINTNVASLQAQRSLNKNNAAQESSFAKLSSGSRITRASDDAAGMGISEKLKAEVRSLKQADRNANDGVSMVQVAEGGLNEVQNILVRLRELAIQSSSDTVGDVERSYTDLEYQNLKLEMERISQVTEFNGTKLLNGEGATLDFQIGTKADPEHNRISYESGNINASAENLSISGLSVNTKDSAQESLANVDKAIEVVSGQRAQLGAIQNRLMSASNNIQVATENLSAANSRIRDVDYADETAKQTQNQILQSAGVSVLAQANMNGQNALKLIG